MEARVGLAAGRALVAATLVLTGCGELPLRPELEPAGELGPVIYSASGRFQRSGYPATGRVTYSLDDAGRAELALDANFSIPPVPRVSILLSDRGSLDDAVKVGNLRDPSGPQRWTFEVPRGAVWRWALLWSEDLSVEVARARLDP